MAKATTESTAPVVPFEHNDRYVTVLVPASPRQESWVRRQLLDQYGTNCPVIVNSLRVNELSTDTIVYLAHPIRVRKKVKDRAGREVWKRVLELHIGKPVDVATEGTESVRRGARSMNYGKLTSALARTAKNDPQGWFFVPFLSGFNKHDFSEATIRLINR